MRSARFAIGVRFVSERWLVQVPTTLIHLKGSAGPIIGRLAFEKEITLTSFRKKISSSKFAKIFARIEWKAGVDINKCIAHYMSLIDPGSLAVAIPPFGDYADWTN
ncbi:MAG TPA: hypothetical protein VEX68_10120 [Bryobacteraceae bacterium]|nr:hypothetical protein [Bryobacteraceae bacterium]